jgi:hypothetical protein
MNGMEGRGLGGIEGAAGISNAALGGGGERVQVMRGAV